MPWIPDVNPSELIESAWGNTIRNHVVNTVASAAERNASIPAPFVGQTVYVTGVNQFQVWNGTVWMNYSASAGVQVRGGSYVGTTDSAGGINIPISGGYVNGISFTCMLGDDLNRVVFALWYTAWNVDHGQVNVRVTNLSGGNFANSVIRIQWILVDQVTS